MHLFADDLAIIIYGALEKRFSDNIQLEMQAKIALEILEKFADDMILPVTISKTKAMLVHNVVAPQLTVVEYKGIVIEFVLIFKYLGVEIRAKLGWGIYIQSRVAIIRNVYAALRILFYSIPRKEEKIKRKLFLAFAPTLHLALRYLVFLYSETTGSN
ncbi:unnamed protein product [Didymodactylos carnosus]|uniref:Reverse transcriptase domain-containing protein n=1 Tax=Didymodactylos carnosus TaxID=1234261 RepID=A0A814LC99_9BILA|nr:unnamed protein product [Didymodactylos carnosus]CAF1063204.1 unnamed protein product [Didymodactylos carnosus]CAF3645937.1 unnamed protein product [Didymodactylos carnosus]CAF3831248.1 unnamed protein product [Didymodactylos carnosus]